MGWGWVVCRWWRKETTHKKKGWCLLFRRFRISGLFLAFFGRFLLFWWLLLGNESAFPLFLGPGGCRAPQARKSYGRGFWGGGFVALYGHYFKKRQLKCDLGDLGDVSAPARRLSWNFDLTARLKPRHSSCLCRYQEPFESRNISRFSRWRRFLVLSPPLRCC